MPCYSKCEPFIEDIKLMIKFGYNNVQIAEAIGLSKATVQLFVSRKLGGNPNYLKHKTKHKHLRKPVMEYFLSHTWEETKKHFKLKDSELKSIFTIGYIDPKLAHLRKDTRRRDAWSTEELRFLFRLTGVISRDEINQHLNRGNSGRVIKEKLMKLGIPAKNVNGLTYSQFTSLFKKKPVYYLATTAGSPGSKFVQYANWKIVPWCHIEEMLNDKYIEHSDAIKLYVETMAMFQRWVHGPNYWQSLTNKPVFKEST